MLQRGTHSARSWFRFPGSAGTLCQQRLCYVGRKLDPNNITKYTWSTEFDVEGVEIVADDPLLYSYTLKRLDRFELWSKQINQVRECQFILYFVLTACFFEETARTN